MRYEGTYIIRYIRVGTYRDLVGKLEGKRPVGRPGVDEELQVKWILKKSDGGWGYWKGLILLRMGKSGKLL
jgi:hypothetical protein